MTHELAETSLLILLPPPLASALDRACVRVNFGLRLSLADLDALRQLRERIIAAEDAVDRAKQEG